MISSTPRPRANREAATAERATFDRVSPKGEGERVPREPEQAPYGELWVFGYGSLMWRPGFAYAFRCKAMLRGWRRSLCIYSHVYRGTPEKPGLVLGLDRGGACAGVAFRVKASLREPTIRYLRDREQATSVYLERMVPVTLESGERVSALTYVADRVHGQYAGRLDRETMLTIIQAGHGQSGDNAAYVTETHDHLAAIGVHDSDLEWLAARLRNT
jgi:cation transport protein ChaC